MNRRTRLLAIATSPMIVCGLALLAFGAGEANVPNTFVPGTTASAAQVNANFTSLATQITSNVPRRTRLDYNTKVQGTTSPVVLTWTNLRTFGTFTKHRADTDVVIELHTDVLVNGNSAQFQLRVNDVAEAAANSGILVRGLSGVPPFIESTSTKAMFEGLPAGVHTVSLWVRSVDGGNQAVAENDYNLDRTVFIEESPSR